MSTEAWGAWATSVVGLFGFLQWWLTTRAQARQRDRELYDWGSRVLSVMARIETACAPLKGDVDPLHAMALADEASAMVDQGRLFFANVSDPNPDPDPAGIRVAILDDVLRPCYIARQVARVGQRDERLQRLAWEARRRFITQLQSEMGPSLRHSSIFKAGDYVAKDPLGWPDPKGWNRSAVAVNLSAGPLG